MITNTWNTYVSIITRGTAVGSITYGAHVDTGRSTKYLGTTAIYGAQM